MKIKRLLIGMLASIALVGCSNEDLIENGLEENKQQAELVRGDAYVNFVINTKTDSSRGVDSPTGTGNSGDTHTSADDNGHHVEGVRNENDVNEVLVVITKVKDTVDETKAVNGYAKQNNGMADLYEIVKKGDANDKVANGYIGYLSVDESEITVEDTKVTMTSPIRLDYTGHYAIAVVVNPVEGLRTAINTCGTDHQKAYEAVLSHADDAYETLNEKNEDGSAKMSFQMSNKYEIIVNAKPENNRPENPAKPENPVQVERTVSKATWRWTEPLTNAPTEDLKKFNNLYPVTVNVKSETPVTGSFWYKEEKTDEKGTKYDTYKYSDEFHKATTVGTEPKIYWVLFKEKVELEDGTTKTLTSADYLDEEGKIVVDYVEAIFAETFVQVEVKNEDGTITKVDYEHIGVVDDTDGDGEDDEQYDQNVSGEKVEKKAKVFFEDYAKASTENVNATMVESLAFVYKDNDSTIPTKTYYVHLTHYALTNLTQKVYTVRHINSTASVERQFGMLDVNEQLVTPYFKEQDSFTQGLKEITDEAYAFGNGVNGNTFVKLPTSGSDGTAKDQLEEGETATNHNDKAVGGFMQYLYENSCEEATAETVTGIVLAGDIYDENGDQVDVLYEYKNRYFRTLQALLEDEENIGNTAFANLTPNSTDIDVKNAGIEIYPEGRCFYYSAQIKHFDDGDKENVGVMEYAIMRNNIYSLGVKSIQAIGDASLNLTPNTPIEDIRSYVELEVSILPWIVRFNDLEL